MDRRRLYRKLKCVRIKRLILGRRNVFEKVF